MRNYLEFGTTPTHEPCAQVGSGNYTEKAIIEYKALLGQIKRQYAIIPEGVRFKRASCGHDFGTYYEMRVYWSDEEEQDFVYRLEDEFPMEWDSESRMFLEESGYYNF